MKIEEILNNDLSILDFMLEEFDKRKMQRIKAADFDMPPEKYNLIIEYLWVNEYIVADKGTYIIKPLSLTDRGQLAFKEKYFTKKTKELFMEKEKNNKGINIKNGTGHIVLDGVNSGRDVVINYNSPVKEENSKNSLSSKREEYFKIGLLSTENKGKSATDFDAEIELKEIEKRLTEQSSEKEEQCLAFITADPKNNNPVKALHQKQVIDDNLKESFLIKDTTQTKFNQLEIAFGNCKYVHITVHCKNSALIFEHNEIKNQEAAVYTEYFLHQLRNIEKPVKLITFVACQSEIFAEESVKNNLAEYAIGTTIDISAGAAVEFTSQFYKELSKEPDIKKAFTNTMIELQNNSYRESDDDGDLYNYNEVFKLKFHLWKF